MSNNERKERNIIFKGKSEEIYKVIIIGDLGVGKRTLLTNLSKNPFEKIPRVGVNITKEIVTIKNDLGKETDVSLMLWDIVGQPQFITLNRPKFNGADGIIFVYDVTRSSSFSNINNWYSTSVKYGFSGIPRILIGNKNDLKDEKKIILPMVEQLSEELNTPFFETSALTGENVKNAFRKIAELVYRAGKSNIKAKELKIGDLYPGLFSLKGFKNFDSFDPKQFSNFGISNRKKESDYTFKSIIVGDAGVGKTALTLRLLEGFFTDPTMTINSIFTSKLFRQEKGQRFDFHIKTISIETREGPIKAKIGLWDTGGQENLSSNKPMYYHGALGAVLVFDLTNSSSFEYLPQWIEEVRSRAKPEIQLLLVGNKSDLIDQRQETLEEINSFKRKFYLYYIETSAKTGEGVYNCFYILTGLMLGLHPPKRTLDTNKDFRPPRRPSGDPGSAKEGALVDF